MGEVVVLKSDPPPVIKYTVTLRGDGAPEMVEADHVQAGSHWVEFFNGGRRTAIVPTASIGFIKACADEGNVLE